MSRYAMTPRAGFGSAVWARAQRRAVAERCGGLKSWQNGTTLARILGHLWIGLVYRRAFFERKFGAIFEHAKATI